MKKITEFLRLLVISPEFAILLGGFLVEFQFGKDIAQLIAGSNPPDEIIKHLALLPAAAAAWMFLAGRTLLLHLWKHLHKCNYVQLRIMRSWVAA